jgi:glycosyltransferase involved in cell wall biosynthesis
MGKTSNGFRSTMNIGIAQIATVDMSLRYLLLNQINEIAGSGYQVIGISSSGHHVDVLEASGIRHIAVPLTRNLTPLTDLRALWRLYWIIRREKFAIVHVHTPKAELLGALAARLARTPIVVDTFRGIYYRKDMHPFWRWFFLRMAQIVAACADVVLSQSREAMQMAIEERVCPSEKIKYLGNGIDVCRFDRDRVSEVAIFRRRAELEIAEDAPVIGYVGRLVEEKGILELLEAAKGVLKQFPNARFLFVGPIDSEKPDALTSQIACDYGIEHACIFTGMRQDMPELYALMDVFVLPSHRESFPRSPMEASAMKVPCVVTDIPGCRETVEQGRNGILVSLGDVEDFKTAIVDILSDPEKARSMGEAGRAMALEQFDERKVFEKVKDEYARLLVEKGFDVPSG